jgi:hypothetical protein
MTVQIDRTDPSESIRSHQSFPTTFQRRLNPPGRRHQDIDFPCLYLLNRPNIQISKLRQPLLRYLSTGPLPSDTRAEFFDLRCFIVSGWHALLRRKQQLTNTAQ